MQPYFKAIVTFGCRRASTPSECLAIGDFLELGIGRFPDGA